MPVYHQLADRIGKKPGADPGKFGGQPDQGLSIPRDGLRRHRPGQVPLLVRDAIPAKKPESPSRPTSWSTARARGYVKVGYAKESDFLEEEKKLIKEIGRMISKAVEKHELQLELKKYVGNLKDLVKAKTKELEKSTKRFEDLFENAPDGIVISETERRHPEGQPRLLPHAPLPRGRIGQAEFRQGQAVRQHPPHPARSSSKN